MRATVFRLLARREYFRAELERRFRADAAVDEEALRLLLDELEQGGWLNDKRAAQAVAHTRARRFGATRIMAELAQRGAGEEPMALARSALEASEVERARLVWRKRFGAPPTSAVERAKQSRFLLSRGFSAEVIAQILRSQDET